MCYSPAARSALTIWLALLLGGPALADGVLIVNGSRSNQLQVAGCVVGPGMAATWSVVPGQTVSNVVDGVLVGTWTFVDGHEYAVQADGGGGVAVVDKAAVSTAWFYKGFAFTFTALLLGLASRWAKMTVTDHGLNE